MAVDEVQAARESAAQETLKNARETGERLGSLRESTPDYAYNFMRVFEAAQTQPRHRDDPTRLLALTIIGGFENDPKGQALNSERLLRADQYQEYIHGINGLVRDLKNFLEKDPRENIKAALEQTTREQIALQPRFTTQVNEAQNAPKVQELSQRAVWLANLLHKTQEQMESVKK